LQTGSGQRYKKKAMMTEAERRLRPEHHVVHDYANLISSGRLITDKESNDKLLKIAPVNSHVWHAFYMNCRKMYEFFSYKPTGKTGKYLRAQQFVVPKTVFVFKHWTAAVQEHMEIQVLHVGVTRTTRQKVWTGSDDKLYLADFEGAWATFLGKLRTEHKDVFRDEIDHRLNSEFRHCGSLGREFIILSFANSLSWAND
jgi:hypothetical protein